MQGIHDKHSIFEIIKEYSFREFGHPDTIARVHAGLMAIERVMMDWAVEQRRIENDGNAEGLHDDSGS